MSEDNRVEKALQASQRALAKINELEAEHENLEDRIIELELRLSEIDENRDYHELTLDEKVGLVREHGYQRAVEKSGAAKLNYNDVMWSVFDGEPSPGHCYKLIRLAAGLKDGRETGSEMPGFRARDPDNDTYHLSVDATKAKNSLAFYPENKATSEGGRVE